MFAFVICVLVSQVKFEMFTTSIEIAVNEV